LVFDNYQDVPAQARLHELLAAGFGEIPEAVRIIVISRHDLPASFARLQACDHLARIDWDQLRLSEKESSGVIRARQSKTASLPSIRALHESTRGWVAGLVLLLEKSRTQPPVSLNALPVDQSALFNYFATEIFEDAEAPVQDLLLRTALLSKITVASAAQVARHSDAERMLSDLARRNYFTVRHADGSYDYHPLFREFLTNRAITVYSAARLRTLRIESAQALVRDGEFEAAAALLRDAADWKELRSLIVEQAPILVAQGRYQLLGEWLQGVPTDIRDADPWLCHWNGINRLVFDPLGARAQLERAYALFWERGEAAGLYSTWAAIAESFNVEYGNFLPADKWIAEYDSLRRRFPDFPSADIEFRVTCARAALLMFRHYGHPDVQQWAERMEAMLPQIKDVHQRTLLAFHLAFHFVWTGQYSRFKSAAAVLGVGVRGELRSTSLAVSHALILTVNDWMFGDPRLAYRHLEEGHGLGERIGILFFHSILFTPGVYASLVLGDFRTAHDYLERLQKIPIRPADVSLLRHLQSMQALHRGDYVAAREYADEALALVRESGREFGEFTCWFMSAIVASICHDEQTWSEHFAATRALAEKSQSQGGRFFCLMVEAEYAVARGRADALSILREVLTISREIGGPAFPWFPHSVLAQLFGLALEHNIERDHVCGLIRRFEIAATDDVLGVEAWPWPLKIYTLGRFNVLLDDKPLAFSGRAQNKPLELLKALIALGGRGVSSATLAQTLWPDAEGDLASKTFDTTLYRLRLLLGDEKFLVLQDGQLTLDPKYCWVDAWAFERMLGQTAELQKALSLYQGPFLNKEDAAWALALRERTRSKFLRAVVRHGESLEQRSNWSAAAQWYQKGIEADHLAEELYRKLMLSYHKLGRCAEALAVYGRCAKALKSVLGVEPGHETRALSIEIQGASPPNSGTASA
jgi:DNA-binding SARP family transcriptional activator